MLNIRKYSDGTVGIPRSDRETEKYLNEHYKKLPNELRWFVPTGTSLEQFKDRYVGRTCYIFGKGQTLDRLKSLTIPSDAILIAINEAIHAVEALGLPNETYGTQLDSALRETCKPKKATLLLSPRCANLYEDYVSKYVIDMHLLGLVPNSISGLFAIKFAKMFGCTNIRMVAFDGALRQDFTYAKTIGHPVSGDARRFTTHYVPLVNALKGLKSDWLTVDKSGNIKTTVAG